MSLREFRPDEILLSQQQAVTVFRMFWSHTQVTANMLNSSSVAFAQGLLLEAIDASYRMGYVEAMFRSFYLRVPYGLGWNMPAVFGAARGHLQPGAVSNFINSSAPNTPGVTPTRMPDNGSIVGLVASFAFRASINWFRHATVTDLEHPHIYEAVRVQLANNFRTDFALIEQGVGRGT
ncbi:MAG TPA: hypothetical protein VGC76_14680 [Pyrinomonadaceae bacterium]|jgi:hypothetical protein